MNGSILSQADPTDSTASVPPQDIYGLLVYTGTLLSFLIPPPPAPYWSYSFLDVGRVQVQCQFLDRLDRHPRLRIFSLHQWERLFVCVNRIL